MAAAMLTSLLKRLSTWTPRPPPTWSSTELPSSAEQELHNLESTIKKIHDILKNAEEKDIDDKSEQLHLRELKEVAYDAEDAVDEYEYEVLHAKVEARRQATATHVGNKQVTFDFNSYHPKVPISDELANRVKDIRKRFEEITSDWHRISLHEKDGKRRCIRKWKPTETSSFFDQFQTFGREDEKEKIIEWLLQEQDESNNRSVSILCIVGMGGLGKTTLAQMTYNDPRVRQHFNLRGWIYVSSHDFNVTSLMEKIHQSFNMDRSVNVRSLDWEKFFLVLDDVWNEKFEHWSSLKTLLVGIGMGKILVTTRNELVAEMMQTTPPFYLSILPLKDSRKLFNKIACEGLDHTFIEIGEKIVNKCRGLPLAIKVLAGILHEEDEEEAWVELLEGELCELDEEKDDIFPILKFSYKHLPIELKQCFMYLCLFPKGSYLVKTTIIQQWMCHGFIQAKGKKLEEDVGNDYFNEFLQRSIIQLDDHFESFRMHDLIHDLAQYVAKDEYLLMMTLESHHMIPKTIRHVSMHIEDKFEIINLEFLREARHLRTLILRVDGEILNIDFLSNLTCLRTLVLPESNYEGRSWCQIEDLPDSIGNLKHLRYLDIGCTNSIPASLYDLHHLHTLKFSGYEIKLSRDIANLINLRHLSSYREYHLPRQVVGLTNLQTLPERIILGVESDGNELMKLRDLKGLPNLKELSHVRGLETATWSDVTPEEEAYLKDMQGIEWLTLEWAEEVVNADERLAARVLDSLQPHRGLIRMVIDNYPGLVLPTWLGHELPALKQLSVAGARRVKNFVVPVKKKSEEWLSSLNPSAAPACTEDVKSRCWFPSLTELNLTRMDELEMWQGAEDSDLPCLNNLYISKCPKLRKLPSLPRLSSLWITACPELKSLSSLPLLTKLRLGFNFNPKLLFGCSCLLMLRRLEITWYPSEILIFPDDGSLDPLEELSIGNCAELTSVEGLNGLTSLHQLGIHACPKLRKLPSLSRLNELAIGDCVELKSLPSLPLLTELSLREFSSELLLGCSCLPMLRTLDITWYSEKTLSFPTSFTQLEKLSIIGCKKLRSLKGFSGLASLQHLDFSGCPKLKKIPSLFRLYNLKIEDCPKLKRLPSLPLLTELYLGFQFISKLLFSCSCLRTLRKIYIKCCKDERLIFPGSLDPLEELVIYACSELRSVEGLGRLASLQHLEIDECPVLRISPHEHLPRNLQYVEINESPGAQEWYQKQVASVSATTRDGEPMTT